MAAPDQQPDEDGEAIVLRTAALARLSIDAKEARGLARDFARILAAFRTLEEVDRADAGAAPPPPRPTDAPPRRPDEPAPFPDPGVLLAAAPDPEDGFFGVPKTLGGPA
jgi:aspartyl/glutamyl-tRNA(Asn/Gln) amidotransferase C subunit